MSEQDREQPLYTISTMARILDVHPQTLRLYEREGLIKPKRSAGNTRLYSENDLEHLRMVLNLTRELGVNLAGAEIILQLRLRLQNMQQDMEALLRFIRDELTRESADMDAKFRQALVRAPFRGLVRLDQIDSSANGRPRQQGEGDGS